MPTTQLEITQHLATLEQLAQAAAVYYEAFAHKLDGLEFNSRPPEQAIRILTESIQPEMGTYALRDGRVVGCGRSWWTRVWVQRGPLNRSTTPPGPEGAGLVNNAGRGRLKKWPRSQGPFRGRCCVALWLQPGADTAGHG